MTEQDIWTFRARPLNVVDGDTIDLEVDLGFRARKTIRARLSGIDAAETYGVSTDSEEYERGHQQTEFAQQWIGEHNTGRWPLLIETETDTGKYGRWLARITHRASGDVLNEDLTEVYPSVQSGEA
jgi:micrococcal nuclease